MKSRFVCALSSLALGAVATIPASAQSPNTSKPTVVSITPYAGYMMFGHYLDGPVGTSLSTANSPLYGAQVGLDIAPNISLVGNLAYSSGDLKIGVPFLGGISVGSTNVLLYDGSLQLSLPMGQGSGLVPFVQAGAGAIRYDISNGFFNTNATNLAGNIGGGIDYQLTPAFGIRLMAKDYIGKFNFKDATNLDLDGKLAHNVALSAGVKIGF